jgi:chorismate-pyruvate lyase
MSAHFLQPAWMPEPLARCYEGLPTPHLTVVEPKQMPSPYRELLVHDGTMTQMLEGFLGQRLALRVLAQERTGSSLWRQVVLTESVGGRPVELGAIRIDLTCFDERAMALVLEGRVPLGRLLEDSRLEYTSRPECFFSTEADAPMSEALAVAGAQRLFGRWNRLLGQGERVLAEVVELLPPLEAAPMRRVAARK